MFFIFLSFYKYKIPNFVIKCEDTNIFVNYTLVNTTIINGF